MKINMKIVSATTLIVALFVASVMVTTLSIISDMSVPDESWGFTYEDLEAGRLGPFFTSPMYWSHYPSLPYSPEALFEWYSLLLVSGLTAVAICVLRVWLKKSLGLVSIVVLAMGAVPYIQGTYVLQAGKIMEPAEYGFWVWVMVAGVLYASLASAFLATMELTGWHIEVFAWLKKYRSGAAHRDLAKSKHLGRPA